MTKRHSGTSGISRRGFLGNVGAGTAASILTARTTSAQQGDIPARAPTHLPAGKPLRVQLIASAGVCICGQSLVQVVASAGDLYQRWLVGATRCRCNYTHNDYLMVRVDYL